MKKSDELIAANKELAYQNEEKEKRIKTEESLRETNEYLENLFRYANAPIIVWDTQFNITRFNPAFEVLTGRKSNDVIGHSIDFLFPAELVENSMELIRKAQEGERWETVEIKILHVDGSIKTLLWNSAFVLGADGKTTIATIAQGQDITGRKQAEEEARQEQSLNKAIIDSIPGTFYVLDENGLYVRWNAYQRDEIVGKPEDLVAETNAADTIHPDDRAFVQSKIANVLINGIDEIVEGRVLLRGGPAFRWLVMTGRRLMIKGRPCLVGIGIDITERKLAEEALRETELKFRTIFDKASDGIIIAENGSSTFYMANNKICEMLGYSQNELLKIGLSEIHLEKDLPHVIEQFERMGRNEIALATDIPVLRKDGNIFYADIKSSSVNLGGKDYLIGIFRDITERKRAEEVLQESEERFRIAAETSNDVVYEWDLKQEVKWFGKIDEMLGYAPGEFPRTLDGLGASVHPEDWVRVMAAVQAHLERRVPYAEEYRALKKDGTFRWWSARGAVSRMPDGKPVRWVGTVTDITERKRTEVALQEVLVDLERRVLERTEELTRSKHLLDETGRLARVGGWELDLEKNELNWSEVTYLIHEIETDYQPTVESGINFYAPEAIPVISQCVDKAIRLGEPFDVELELITAKKNRLWVRAIGEAYREKGKIVKISGVFQDINERKLAEIEVLKKSEQLQLLSNELEIIIDSIPGLVFYKDTNNRFIRVNKYISDAYNLSKKQLEGINLNELHSPEQAQAYYEADLQVIRSRQPKINIDEPWETETGTRWVSTSKIPYFNETGEVVGVIGVSLDVTERKLAEEELEKYREHLEELVEERTAELADAIVNLERSNKELEQFAYVASHDLQEPLRMVSSFTQLLERRYKDKLDQDANEFIQYAVDGANRMQKLINDLLDYSRITSRGKDFTKVDISQVLGQAISNLQQLIIENTALITNEELPELKVDESQILRVFQNLIENAVKFKKKSELPKIHISCKKKNDFYEFAVSDNGIGIDLQFHDRVFTIFQRLHSKEEYPGTGIGLSICKRIVERHGGKIWFESKENEGTTFYFTLKE